MQTERATTASLLDSLVPILEPAQNIVTVPRPLPPLVAEAMVAVVGGEPFSRSARVEALDPDVSSLVEPVRDGLARRYLARDITEHIRAFGAVMRRRHLHARLSIVTDDACRKIHSDHVSIRLLCTYAGPGTEWVTEEDVARENLARIDVDVRTANRSVLRRPSAIRHCAPGEVILLKGDAYDGNEGRGAVHRSPPIEARGLRRLVLKIDEHPCGC
ncbi:MAG: DUF1826 domain-containing protein [Sandaracinaceae bacterium]